MGGFQNIELDLSDFFHLSTDMMCIATPEGQILACNQAFLDGDKRSPEETAELNFVETLHPDDLPAFAEAMEQVANGEAVTALYLRYQHKDGHYVHSEWSCRARDGLLYASGRDITERIEREAELAAARERYEALAELAPVGIFMTDGRGNAVFRNNRLRQLSDQGEEEGSGLGWMERIHPDDRARVEAGILEATSKGERNEDEYRILTSDGREVWVHAIAEPLSGGSGYIGVVEDITERVESHMALEASHRRFELLANLAPVGIFRIDAEGNSTYTNKYLAEVMGLSPAEASGRGWQRALHPEDRERVTQDWARCTTYNKEYIDTLRYLKPDGDVRWANVHSRPIAHRDGTLAGYIGVVTDITESRQRQHLLKLAGRIAQVGGWELDVSSGALNWSPEILELIEADPASNPDLDDVYGLYDEAGKANLAKALEAAIEHGRPVDYEAEITTFKGNRRWIHVAGEPEMGHGKCVRLSGVLQDITERMHAQRAERTANEKLRLLFERAPIGMALHRFGGEYIQSNDTYSKILGIADDQARGTNTLEMMLPEYADGIQAAFQDLVNKGKYGPFRSEMRRPDGSTVVTVSNGVMIEDEMGDKFVWSIVEDISVYREMERARTEHERELEAANRALRESNREIEEFTYAASHDLKEPLHTIVGFCELLDEDLKNGDYKGVVESAEVIRSGAERMRSLVNDMLALSRSGKQPLNATATALGACVAEAKRDLTSLIERTGALIEVDDLPVALCDPEHVSRLFQNLITNAIKYQPEGRRPEIRISGSEIGEMCEVRVSDNGIGIDPRCHEKIFGAFQRLHSRGKYDGSGIGLAICRKTAERHGGSIRVESAPDKGSTFILTLPCAKPVLVEARNE